MITDHLQDGNYGPGHNDPYYIQGKVFLNQIGKTDNTWDDEAIWII